MGRYIDVALNVPLNMAFTYEVPAGSNTGSPYFGRRVEVRFGSRKMTGTVVADYDSIPSTCGVTADKIRPAVRFLDDIPLLTQELFDIAKFMCSYYISPIGECVSAMLPSGRRETEYQGFPAADTDELFTPRTPSEEQEEAVEGILSPDKGPLVHYLFGPTGSGKTEVFLSAAERVLKSGRGVIYLVPEIGLTPQVAESAIARFGNTAAVIHSELTPSQRLGEWKRILRKEARIVIGARSAIFAPVPDLGLVIMDEEHDSSYKSGSSPRYHARQIAMKRCSALKIPLVMGSATPSAEAWYSMQKGTIKRHVLTKRLSGGKMPDIECVNLSSGTAGDSCISKELETEIKHALHDKRQTILFLNRRGFTHFFRCTTCGYELKCRNCSVPMTYHRSENRLRCHYCGFSMEPPKQCPECGSLDVGYSGFGTEYIEAEVRAKFPSAKTIRVDTDSLKKRGELQEKLDAFRRGEYDILLGTQMVAKGLNFPNLRLVGVVLADTSLHLPDFRASERTFSLITQVAGRAGRFFPDGKVIVQSYSPDREPIALAAKGDTETFYKSELSQRELLGFPPFTRLLRLVFRSQVPNAAQTAAMAAASIIKSVSAPEEVEVLGPAECPLEMIAGNFRHQIILRGDRIAPLVDAAKKLVWGYTSPKNVYIEVDVDPVSML